MDQQTSLGDPKFIEKFADGDKRTFSEFVAKESQYLYAFILKTTKDNDVTKEVVQEAFVRAYMGRHTYNPDLSSARTWVTNIALNVMRDYYKRERKEFEKAEKLAVRLMRKTTGKHQCSAEVAEKAQLIRNAISKFDPAKQLTFRLIFEAGLSDSEIAEELNITKSAVRKRRERFRKMLKTILKE